MADRYRIVSQQRTTLYEYGEFRQVWQVRYKLNIPPFTSATVEVPVELYSPENVKTAVDEAVETILAVHNI